VLLVGVLDVQFLQDYERVVIVGVENKVPTLFVVLIQTEIGSSRAGYFCPEATVNRGFDRQLRYDIKAARVFVPPVDCWQAIRIIVVVLNPPFKSKAWLWPEYMPAVSSEKNNSVRDA